MPPPSTERLDLSVALPDDCRRLALAVEHPALGAGDDAEVKILAYAAALKTANERIGARDVCELDLRARYAAYAKGGT